MSTVADLEATITNGDSIVWYSDSTGGTPLPLDEILVDGFYYAQGEYDTGCISDTRLTVEVIIDYECVYLEITKEADVVDVQIDGDTITYTITVENVNDYPLQSVVVTDALVSDLQYVNGDLNSDGMLDPDETWIYTATYMVTQDVIDNCGVDILGDYDSDGDIDNRVDADAQTLAGVDIAQDAHAFDEVPIDYSNSSNPEFTVTKIADLDDVSGEGDIITYTITVTNTATYALANVVVEESLPDVTLSLQTGDLDSDAMLDVDEVWVYTGTLIVTQYMLMSFGIDSNGDADDDGDIDNEVTVTATTPCDDPITSQNASTTVMVNFIFIPEGFSPDGDDYNDSFEIIGVEVLYPNFTLEIYNRWGNLVHEYDNNGSIDPQWWDGYSTGRVTLNNNKKVPEGTYYYILDPNDGEHAPLVNWVYINRNE